MVKIKKCFMVLLLLMIVSGCSSSNEKLHVTIIVKSTSSQFFKSMLAGANAACKEYNIDLSFMGPESEEDYETQIDMINAAVKDGTDAIILSAIDYNKMVEPVENAVKAKVPVIIIDSDVDSDKVSARIMTDNELAGEMAGDVINRRGEERIVLGIVNFDANTANGQERESGVRKAIRNNKAVKEIHTINVKSNVSSSTQGAKDLLRTYPEINMVVTFNEWTTLGVGNAIKEDQRNHEIYVIGFDNNPISIGMLESGEVDALIVQNPFVMGYLGVEKVQKILNNKPLSEDTVYTKTVLINKENMFDKEIQKILFPFD